MYETPRWSDKLRVLFYGPGWDTGKPRLGSLEDIPDIKGDVDIYDPPNTFNCQLYYSLHFLLVLLLHVNCASYALTQSSTVNYSLLKLLFNFCFILLSFISFASLMENTFYSSILECGRCLLFILCQEFILLYPQSTVESFQLTSISQLTEWSVAVNAAAKLIYFTSMMYHLFNFIHVAQKMYSIDVHQQVKVRNGKGRRRRQPSLHITSNLE